jgi:hypothetical protein
LPPSVSRLWPETKGQKDRSIFECRSFDLRDFWKSPEISSNGIDITITKKSEIEEVIEHIGNCKLYDSAKSMKRSEVFSVTRLPIRDVLLVFTLWLLIFRLEQRYDAKS